ncbi:MAG: PilZ domain-containing protein [Anaerolineaceae bacterium]|nr:PilZ domain-containing protein [Anaerolineaceae bacterium]
MSDSTNQNDDRRQNYRIIYPETYHPSLMIRNIQYDILDLSETGVRFKLKENVKLPGDLFHAEVKLHNDSNVEILGRIIRITGQHAAMFMVVKKIPYQVILAEQAYLRNMD